MIELKVNETETEYFIIGPDTASRLEIAEKDVLLAENPVNHKSIAGEVKIEKGVEEGTVFIDVSLLNSIELEKNSKLLISSYEKEIIKPVDAEFTIERIEESDEDPIKLIKEGEEEFIDFLKNRMWTKDSKFLWDDKKLVVSIDEGNSEIEKNSVVDFTRLEEFSYRFIDKKVKSYSAVLLIDLSGSMEMKDLTTEGIESMLDKIEESIQGDEEFLEILKNESKIKRSQGAILYCLTYLIQEVEKGLGEKMAVVLFSDESSIITFNDRKYFSTELCGINRASEKIIDDIKYHPRGRTNISAALTEAIETMKDFEHEKMKMILLLTDGEPHPPSVDDKKKVIDIVENRLAPRKDVIVNTMGLGDEVDHNLLDKIASKTDGEYTYVKNLQGLIETCSVNAESVPMTNLNP